MRVHLWSSSSSVYLKVNNADDTFLMWSNEMSVSNFGLRPAQTRSWVSYEETTVLSSWPRSAS